MENVHWIENDDFLNGDDFGAAHRYNNEWYMPKFHTHTHYEFYLFLSGNVQILIEDDAFDARPMDLFIFPPGILHRAYLVDPHTNYERAYFYATRQALHNFSNDQLPLLPTLEKAVLQKDYCYHIGEKNGNKFLQLIDAYIRDESLKDPYSLEMQCLRMHYLSLEVCRIIHGKDAVSANPPDRISDVIRFINSHITEPLSLDSLSEQFFISKYTLLHEFKSYANISVYQYILSKRVLYAQLLMQRGISPGPASKQSGFNDCAGFYRAFVSQNNISPKPITNSVVMRAQKNDQYAISASCVSPFIRYNKFRLKRFCRFRFVPHLFPTRNQVSNVQ